MNSRQRREVVDYITGTGLDLDRYFPLVPDIEDTGGGLFPGRRLNIIKRTRLSDFKNLGLGVLNMETSTRIYRRVGKTLRLGELFPSGGVLWWCEGFM